MKTDTVINTRGDVTFKLKIDLARVGIDINQFILLFEQFVDMFFLQYSTAGDIIFFFDNSFYTEQGNKKPIYSFAFVLWGLKDAKPNLIATINEFLQDLDTDLVF